MVQSQIGAQQAFLLISKAFQAGHHHFFFMNAPNHSLIQCPFHSRKMELSGSSATPRTVCMALTGEMWTPSRGRINGGSGCAGHGEITTGGSTDGRHQWVGFLFLVKQPVIWFFLEEDKPIFSKKNMLVLGLMVWWLGVVSEYLQIFDPQIWRLTT